MQLHHKLGHHVVIQVVTAMTLAGAPQLLVELTALLLLAVQAAGVELPGGLVTDL